MGRNKWVRSAMKQMMSLAMRKKEKLISSKELTAARKLHNALKKLTGRLVRQLMVQFGKELSHAKAESEQMVKQQDSKLRKLMAAIDRMGLHVNSNAALKKLQKQVKAMEKREEKQTSKHMISLAMRKEEKMITSKEMTAAKKLHTTLKKLTGRLVRQLMAQFVKELSHAKAEREHRLEQQDAKLRKLMVAIDRIGSHVNSGAALKKLQSEIEAMKKRGKIHGKTIDSFQTSERKR